VITESCYFVFYVVVERKLIVVSVVVVLQTMSILRRQCYYVCTFPTVQ